MRPSFLAVACALAGHLVICFEADGALGLVKTAVRRTKELQDEAADLRVGIRELQRRYDSLLASTIAQRRKEAQYQQEVERKLERLTRVRGLSTAVSTRGRGLSSHTCADPDAHALLVKGVCSCVGGLLVEGRNVTKELDMLEATTLIKSSTAEPGNAVANLATTFNDSHTCNDASNEACRGAFISHYDAVVNCTGTTACYNATFFNVDTVVCAGGASACQYAVFVNVQNVLCGSGSRNCYGINVTNASMVQFNGEGEEHGLFSILREVGRVECNGEGAHNCAAITVTEAGLVQCNGVGHYNCFQLVARDVEQLQCNGDGYRNCGYFEVTNAGAVECDGDGFQGCYLGDLTNVRTLALTGSGTNAAIYLTINNDDNDYSGVTCTVNYCSSTLYGVECGDGNGYGSCPG